MSQGAVNINPEKRRIMAHADDDLTTVAELVMAQWRKDRRLQNLPSAFIYTEKDTPMRKGGDLRRQGVRTYQIRPGSNWKIWWMKDGTVISTLPVDPRVIGTNGVNLKPEPGPR